MSRHLGTDEILRASANHPYIHYFVAGDGSAFAAICTAMS